MVSKKLMLYPRRESAKAEPVWVPFYLLFQGCCYRNVFCHICFRGGNPHLKMSPQGCCESRARIGSYCFYLCLNCCLGMYFDVSKTPLYIRLFEIMNKKQ